MMKRTKKKAPSEIPSSVKSVIGKLQQRTHIAKTQITRMLESVNPPVFRRSSRLKAREVLLQRQAFYRLLEDDLIKDFLASDASYKVSDKYLLAMVFIYFQRIGLRHEEYNRTDFFMGLFVANSMEEDRLEYKFGILPWMLGCNWYALYPTFMRERDNFWRRLKHRAWVRREICDELIAMDPTHWVWKRERVHQETHDTIASVNSDMDSSSGESGFTPYMALQSHFMASEPSQTVQNEVDEIIVISS